MSKNQNYLDYLGITRYVPLGVTLMQATPEKPQPEQIKFPVETATESLDNWQELATAVKNCQKCSLCQTRKNTVFGVGNQQAKLLIIGEAPGATEDQKGEPFVGQAGQLLDRMLAAIQLDRTQVYIANILKCRPPNNRDPLPTEVAECLPYLLKQIELMQPQLILALGRVAAQNLLNTQTPLNRLRGQTFQYGPQQTPMIVTYHPAYLLRNPADKKNAWVDLQRVQAFLKELTEPQP